MRSAPAAAVAALLLLAGCGSMTERYPTFFGASHTSPVSYTLPGISDLDTISKDDKADADWWAKYYGRSE